MAAIKDQKIKGIPQDTEKLLVQKSNPLYSLWKSKLTLSEFKILDVYLSRIDSHHSEKRTVVFEKGELEKLLGVTQLKKEDLDNRLDHLLGNVITLDDPRYKRGIHKVTLFEESEAQMDNNGVWTVSLSCTQKAMEYFFNTEKLGYLRYRLRSITSLTSRYSYVLFCYIEKNRYRKKWEIQLSELKEILGCTEDEIYNQYKYFNQRILKKCRQEISKKTDCRYSYTPIKKGRNVTSIQFEVQTIAELDPVEEDSNQITIEQYQESLAGMELYKAATNNEFNDTEMQEIIAILDQIPESKLHAAKEGEPVEAKKAAYLRGIYARMQKYSEKHTIKSRQAYLVKMLEKEVSKKQADDEKPVTTTKKNSFNDFKQNPYDFEKLEKQLLGN